MKAKWLALAGVVALAVSCGGNGSDRERALDRIAAHTEAMRAETLVHETHIAGMTSPAGVPAEEDRHHDHIDEHLLPMHESIDHVGSSCHMEQEDMHHWMEFLEGECDRHRDEMLEAVDMDEMHDEERRHQSWMESMLEAMDSMHDQMEEGCAQDEMMDD